MARLIEMNGPLPAQLTLETGDVLVLSATGGHVRSGSEVVELLGPFYPGFFGQDGEVVAPMGAPDKTLFRARQPGTAQIEAVMGDPWSATTTNACTLTVRP